MAKTITSFTLLKPTTTKPSEPFNSFPKRTSSVRQSLTSTFIDTTHHRIGLEHSKNNNRAASRIRANALPDWPLMAVLVEGDLTTHKSIWHLSDEAMKSVYTFYIMFTCWGCCFFGATKDPYYDSESYRKDGGDGSGHWVYDKQEDIEESSRAALWREELIDEIEKKVGGLRELEEAGKKEEQLVK